MRSGSSKNNAFSLLATPPTLLCWSAEVKSLRTHFKVLGLVQKPQLFENFPVLVSRTAIFFESIKFCRLPEKCFWKTFFWGCEKNLFEELFFWEHLPPVSLVVGLGLDHSSSWSREDLSSDGLSLALASDFFFLFLAVVSSTPPLLECVVLVLHVVEKEKMPN